MKLPLIEQRRANHFIYGLAVYLVVTAALVLTPYRVTAAGIGFVAALAVGVLKEWADRRANARAARRREPLPHGVHAYSAISTMLGGLAGLAASYLGTLV